MDTPNPTNSVFIVGCGDIGRRVAALEQAAGHSVVALVRSEAAATRLARENIRAVRGDLDSIESLDGLPKARTLYYFAPPPAKGTEDPRLKSLLAALEPGRLPERAVYISTSGVYGDCGGAWVDEDRPPDPRTGRSGRRLDAERALLAWGKRRGVACTILRVPGIYSPGRLPLERLRQGVPVIRECESPWSNRIHAEDLAAACHAAARLGRYGGIYNAADGQPTTMTDYFYRVADLYGLPRPPAIGLAEARRRLSPNLLSFLEESKRLDNRRMLGELQVCLRFPNLASGLAACRREGGEGKE